MRGRQKRVFCVCEQQLVHLRWAIKYKELIRVGAAAKSTYLIVPAFTLNARELFCE